MTGQLVKYVSAKNFAKETGMIVYFASPLNAFPNDLTADTVPQKIMQVNKIHIDIQLQPYWEEYNWTSEKAFNVCRIHTRLAETE